MAARHRADGTEDGTELTFSAEGGTHGTGFSRHDPPPEDAIQFSREIWMQVPPQTVQVLVTEDAAWEHLDGSRCPDGLDVPHGEWTEVSIPFTCAQDRQIRHAACCPFWLDEIPVSSAGFPPGDTPAT